MSVTAMIVATALGGLFLLDKKLDKSLEKGREKALDEVRKRDEYGKRLAESLSNLRNSAVESSPWWSQGIPPSTKLIIDTCVWLNDSPRVKYWFDMLQNNATAANWQIVVLKSVYEEISKAWCSEELQRKAALAKKRISRFQELHEDNFIIEGELKFTREKLYADKEIMQYVLSEEGKGCILFTFDRDLKIRLKKIAEQKKIAIEPIRHLENFSTHEKYSWVKEKDAGLVGYVGLVTESCYTDDAKYMRRRVTEADAREEIIELVQTSTSPKIWVEAGDYLYNGTHGVTQDFKLAFECYMKSVAVGSYHWGYFNVGKCYLHGKGVEKDEDEARKWFLKAWENHENLWALYWLAQMGDSEAAARIRGYRASNRLTDLLVDNDVKEFMEKTKKFTPEYEELPFEITIEPRMKCDVTRTAKAPSFVFPAIRITNCVSHLYGDCIVRVVNSETRNVYHEQKYSIPESNSICIENICAADESLNSFEVVIENSDGMKRCVFERGWQDIAYPVINPIEIYWRRCSSSLAGRNPKIRNKGALAIKLSLWRRERHAKGNPYSIMPGEELEIGFSEWRHSLDDNEQFWIKIDNVIVNCVIRPRYWQHN